MNKIMRLVMAAPRPSDAIEDQAEWEQSLSLIPDFDETDEGQIASEVKLQKVRDYAVVDPSI